MSLNPICLTGCLIVLGCCGEAFATDRTVQVEPQHRSDPVMVTGVTIGGVPIECGLVTNPVQLQPVTPFAAGGDWLQNLTITILNRTNRNVSYAQITLAFPETGDGSSPASPQHVYHISLGRIPDSAAFSGAGKPLSQRAGQLALSLLPGQSLTIHVGDYIDRLKASFANTAFASSFGSLTKCIIRRSAVFFDDGMRWSVALFSVPDSANPGKFKNLEPQFFPGVPTWPPPAL